MQKLDKQSLKLLIQALPDKWAEKIQGYLNYEFSKSYIRSVLYGQRHRDEIILAAIELSKEEKLKIDSFKNEILELSTE